MTTTPAPRPFSLDGFRLSPSGASAWDECPKRWHGQYVLGVKKDGGPEAFVGNLVHTVLEHAVTIPQGKRTVRALAEIAAEHWPEDAPDMARGLAFTLAVAATRHREIAGVPLVGVTTEQKVHAEVKGVPFTGTIDRTELLPSGAVRVLDYKTGKRDERYMDEKIRQVMLYAAALEARDGVTVTEAAVYWIVGGAVDEWEADEDAKGEAAAWLAAVWREINVAVRDDVFDSNPGPLCSWCPLCATCPEGMAAVRKRAKQKGKSLGQYGIAALEAENRQESLLGLLEESVAAAESGS